LVAGLCDRRLTSKPLADVRIPGIDETSRADVPTDAADDWFRDNDPEGVVFEYRVIE